MNVSENEEKTEHTIRLNMDSNTNASVSFKVNGTKLKPKSTSSTTSVKLEKVTDTPDTDTTDVTLTSTDKQITYLTRDYINSFEITLTDDSTVNSATMDNRNMIFSKDNNTYTYKNIFLCPDCNTPTTTTLDRPITWHT